MSRDAPSPRRRGSLRLQDYNYSDPNAYFFTVCTFKKIGRFGEVDKGEMHMSEEGKIVRDVWETLGNRYPNVETDSFVIMPNHVHGIVKITSDEVGAIHELPLHTENRSDTNHDRIRRRKMLLPKVIGYLKMNSSKRINQLRGTPGSRVWQRNYYEHVIRSKKALHRLRRYIEENPLNWTRDPERIFK